MYKIYPSLLDNFSNYLNWEEESGKPWNRNKEPEEVKEELRIELINSINRVRFENEAVDKGTALNAIIDCYIHNKSHVPSEKEPYCIQGDNETNIIQVTFPSSETMPNRNYIFNRRWCIEQATYFKDCLSQIFVKGLITTKYGDAELYGLVDEMRGSVVFDIKSTTKYRLGKYKGKWQRHVYPYCLIQSGMIENVTAFEYTVLEIRQERTGIISGTRYPEYYTYNHEQSVKLLTNHVERFIEFLEANRELITDKKIFGNGTTGSDTNKN